MALSTDAGATQFARYAFPPNELGYCGPADAGVLLRHTTDGGVGGEVASLAPQFDGAWAYLEVIAAAAGLDPLDPLVVDAYWLGTEPLSAVDAGGLLATLRDRFPGQPGGLLASVAPSPDVMADHGFQVYVVYPWLRLLGNGSDVPRSVLDSCRIRWGTVVSVAGERLSVASTPLAWDGARLGLGPSRVEEVRWSSAGLSLQAEPAPGDVVSMHWDWVCERLTPLKAAALARSEGRSLRLANELLR